MKLELTPEQAEQFIKDQWLTIQLPDSYRRIHFEFNQDLDFSYFEYIPHNQKRQFVVSCTSEEANKFVPRRPRDNYGNTPMCPCCGTYLIYNFEHCPKCGQKIDYSEKGLV